MPMTLEQLKNQLSAIEPDVGMYAEIGPTDIPNLQLLLKDREAWMAARAVFALSRIPDATALTVLSRAAADPRQEVRVAVAASVMNLKPSDANPLLLKLIADSELGVRKFAVQSVSRAHDASVHAKVREVEARDASPPIREIAKSKIQELRLNER